MKLNISKNKRVKKFYQSSYIMILTDLSNTIKKLWEKISFHKHFKYKKSGAIFGLRGPNAELPTGRETGWGSEFTGLGQQQ